MVRAARIRIQRRTGALTDAGVPVPSNPRLELEAGQRSQPQGNSTDIGIRLSQEFWIAGQGGLRENAALSALAAARLDYDFLAAGVRARTRAAFLSVLVAEEAVSTAERVENVNRRLQAFARKRLDAGAGTRIEANAAGIGYQRARALLAEARNQATQARLQLKDRLAIDPARRLAVVGDIGFSQQELPESDTLLTRAVARRGDLEAAAARVAAAKDQLSLAKRRLVPNLTVFGFYREEAGGRGDGGADISGGGVGFELPLLDRYAGDREIASADLDSARLDQDTLQRAVRLQVLSGISAYRSARESADALGRAVLEAAEHTLELTRRSFAAGKVGAPAITSAQNNLIDVRRDYLEALGALIAAGTDLERATGGLVVMATGESENAQ
ncbi:outer membrane efflux protein [Salinisphaera sp. T31B1]